MIKEPPTRRSLRWLAVFLAICIAGLLYLWLGFGGTFPFNPTPYGVTVLLPDATNVVVGTEVRIAGIDVGHVAAYHRQDERTAVVLNIQPSLAPLPSDTTATLRQKTLGGEAYIELSPGNPRGPHLRDGATIPARQATAGVELDQYLSMFDSRTRRAYQQLVQSIANSLPPAAATDLNYATADTVPYADITDQMFGALAQREQRLNQLVRNTGVVFDAFTERRDQLRELTLSADRYYTANARQAAAITAATRLLPGFLTQNDAFLRTLDAFSVRADKLARLLFPVADRLGPTIAAVKAAAPAIIRYSRLQQPLAEISSRGLPAANRLLRYLPAFLGGELKLLWQGNPVLSDAIFNRETISSALESGYPFAARLGQGTTNPGLNYERGIAAIESHGLQLLGSRPPWDRGSVYARPDAYRNGVRYGIVPSADCSPVGGPKSGIADGTPPCALAGPNGYSHDYFAIPKAGDARTRKPPPS